MVIDEILVTLSSTLAILAVLVVVVVLIVFTLLLLLKHVNQLSNTFLLSAFLPR
jgi:hypothetical protein